MIKNENPRKDIFDTSINDFKSIQITLVSPEEILSWSYGEIANPETVNFKTGKPEKGGLFCERIFGPTKDWTCACGAHKGEYNANTICERCGVPVTKSIVRRTRMGHIELECPVAHINFLKSNPSILATVLDIPAKTLEKVVYYTAYMVLDPKETQYKKYDVISEKEYREIISKEGRDSIEALIGAEAVLRILREMDVDAEISVLEERLRKRKNAAFAKRLELLRSMRQAGIKPEWMILTRVPVIPPDMRPMIQINGGRFATSDANDLYRRLINRNIRLKKMIDIDTPEMIRRNEKRLLQEAVDCLFANGKRGKSVKSTNNRAYKSLSDALKGKKGTFRQNLLGKRVDYSGRSVIIVGPELRMHQCGLPRVMALELFKPYVMRQLKLKGIARNYKVARKLIDTYDYRVWDILEKVVEGRPVLLNRAPTLHRISIQAFEIVLIDGEAIRLHPLVCTAFNADFDGDQMAVHVPLSKKAIKETYDLMLAPHNILNPKDGKPIAVPSQDMVLGLYYLTLEKESRDVRIFKDEQEAKKAYELKSISLHQRILVRRRSRDGLYMTTTGKIIFSEIFPSDFDYVNDNIFEKVEDISKIEEKLSSTKYKDPYGTKKKIKDVINVCYHRYGESITVGILDSLKDLGFRYATVGGISFGFDDIIIPKEKDSIISEAKSFVSLINDYYKNGFLTDNERYSVTIELWKKQNDILTDIMMAGFGRENPIYMMAHSGARGTVEQIKQLAGMRGLMANTVGKIIEFPIVNNFKEGIGILDYFTSSHGARKGGVDTALKTADSGYLTRRLVDVAQNLIIREDDCHTEEYLEVDDVYHDGRIIVSLEEWIDGRYSAEDLFDKQGDIIVRKNEYITKNAARKIIEQGFKKVKIRSLLTCETREGFCAKCYGADLAAWNPSKKGMPVGIIAAQSIGEPGTQLTMRTFHTGGIAGADITQGLPRVEELLEAQKPDVPALISPISGKVKILESEKTRKIIVENSESKVSLDVPSVLSIKVLDDELVEKGRILTSGALKLDEALNIMGKRYVEKYIVDSIEQVYALQGVPINPKHIEVFVKQMLRKMIVEYAGDSDFIQGSIIDIEEYNREVERLTALGKELPIVSPKITGIKKVALTTDSFLSAASFQETIKILTEAAIRGKVDYLKGLKENLIIGKLIPCGEGYENDMTEDKSDDETKGGTDTYGNVTHQTRY